MKIQDEQGHCDKDGVKHLNYPKTLEQLYIIAERDYISNRKEGKNYYMS